jgi:hypothetical protein
MSSSDERVVFIRSVEWHGINETVRLDEMLFDCPSIPNLVDRSLIGLAEFVPRRFRKFE